MSAPDAPRLTYFPVTFFAVTMGLGGLTLALRAASESWALAGGLSALMLVVSVAVFIALAITYGVKILRHPEAVGAEWHHPVKMAFFPTITISGLLIASALRGVAEGPAAGLWAIATLGQGALTLAVVRSWIAREGFETAHLSPAWFIPAVGNVIVPLAGAPLGFTEISWLFFSAGLIFWLILLTLVFNRLVFHAPLPARLLPTLTILIAPPAVAFIAWTALTGEIDAFARILLNVGYVFALLVLLLLPRILSLPFAMSFWALSFPVAALTSASFHFGHHAHSAPHRLIGLVLLLALIGVVGALVLRTLKAMRNNEICVPD